MILGLSKGNILYIENTLSSVISGFVKFLQKTKDWVDEKFLGKIKDAPSHLKPVIGLAAKDATIFIAACLLGKFTLESDDSNYTATK
jgi:hypothetical protein